MAVQSIDSVNVGGTSYKFHAENGVNIAAGGTTIDLVSSGVTSKSISHGLSKCKAAMVCIGDTSSVECSHLSLQLVSFNDSTITVRAGTSKSGSGQRMIINWVAFGE